MARIITDNDMNRSTLSSDDALWAHHHAQFRDPRQIVAQWPAAGDIHPATFAHRVTGRWWDVLDELGITLLVTREYEHLVQSFCFDNNRPRTSYLPLPHPNGMAVDASGRLILASTRNPNMIFDFAPGDDAVYQPRQAHYYPGRLYLHDIALIGGELYGNAVGMNAVVRLNEGGRFEPVWWPQSIDSTAGPRFERNYLQLNSIAAGPTLAQSFFGASAAAPSGRRPGQRHFPVDGRGVVFSGATRKVHCDKLTRPHSTRLSRNELWLDNSGYGEVGRVVDGSFEPVARLPGWTRGLGFVGNYAFVGTSRVLPRYRQYAPGLDPERCVAGVHVLELKTGRVVGSIRWPHGNQLFAIEAVRREIAIGFADVVPRRIRSAA